MAKEVSIIPGLGQTGLHGERGEHDPRSGTDRATWRKRRALSPVWDRPGYMAKEVSIIPGLGQTGLHGERGEHDPRSGTDRATWRKW